MKDNVVNTSCSSDQTVLKERKVYFFHVGVLEALGFNQVRIYEKY